MDITQNDVKNGLVTTATLRIGGSQNFRIAVLSHLPQDIWSVQASGERNVPTESKIESIVERICSDRFWKVTNTKSSGCVLSKKLFISAFRSLFLCDLFRLDKRPRKRTKRTVNLSTSASSSSTSSHCYSQAEESDGDTDGDASEQAERLAGYRIHFDCTAKQRAHRANRRSALRDLLVSSTSDPTLSSSQLSDTHASSSELESKQISLLSSSAICAGRACSVPVRESKKVSCSTCGAVFHSKACLTFYVNDHGCTKS
jgi:hypothetical protein